MQFNEPHKISTVAEACGSFKCCLCLCLYLGRKLRGFLDYSASLWYPLAANLDSLKHLHGACWPGGPLLSSVDRSPSPFLAGTLRAIGSSLDVKDPLGMRELMELCRGPSVPPLCLV